MAHDSEQEFLRACGGAGPLRLGVGAAEGGEVDLRTCPGPFALVGRDPGAEVVLDHPDVGRRHAYLQLIGGRIFFVDLGSRTGVHREDGPVPSGWLDAGEAIRIGPFLIRAAEAPARAEAGCEGDLNPLEVTRDLPSDQPGMTLEFLRSKTELVAWRMNRVLVLLGRSSECRVRLEGSEVSSFHCSLLRTPEGLWAVDLLGRGGIRVNRQPVRFARLGEGEELRLGRHRIRLRSGTAPPVVGALPALQDAQSRALATPPFMTFAPPDLGPGAGPPGMADSLFGQMTGHFALIQQQMFEQFQQTMMMMAQTFGALHRDHAESVRVELERLRQLNKDLAVLQGELVARRGATPPLAGSLSAPPPPVNARPRGPVKPVKREVDPNQGHPTVPRPREANAARAGDEIHAQLTGRIAEIQREQQGRWQHLLDLMMSRSSGTPLP